MEKKVSSWPKTSTEDTFPPLPRWWDIEVIPGTAAAILPSKGKLTLKKAEGRNRKNLVLVEIF